MLRRAALLLAGVFALVSVLAAPQAQAQTWKKKRPKKAKKVKKADSKAKKNKRGAKKKRRPKKAASDSDDSDLLVEEDGDDEEWQDDDDDDDEIDDEILIDGDDGDPASSDLSAGATAGARRTTLETTATTFARTGVDLERDDVPDPEAVAGSPNREDVMSFWLHGLAEGVRRFDRRFKLKVAGRFDADLTLDSDTDFVTERYEGRVWETYADVYTSKLDVRVGNQFVAWGTADLLSPNDVVNARDLRRGFLMTPAEQRLPVLALSASLHDGPFHWEALWVPVAPTNRFELLQGDYALLGPNGATALERKVGSIVSALQDDPTLGPGLQAFVDIGEDPDHGLETGEVGTSIGLQFSKLDVFGYFLYGHERNPRIEVANELRDFFPANPGDLTADALSMRVTDLGAMGITAVDVSYPRRLHIGGAVATRLEPVGFKLDIGYTLDANTMVGPPGAGPLSSFPEEHDHVTTTVSLDYERGDELELVVESSYTRVLGVPGDQAVFQMDGDDLLLFGSRFRWSPGSGPLSIRFLGFVDARSDPSYALRPALRLSGRHHLSVELAGVLYGGPTTSLGGIQKRNDEIQLTVQYGL